MKLSKGNLLAVELTKTDKAIPALDNVHITKDGGTVATNGLAVLCVSPVADDMREKVPLDERKMFSNETIASETAKEVLKNMPRDTKFRGVLEHCDYASGKFELTDGKRRRTLSAKTWPRDYVNYRDVLTNAHTKRDGKRCAVNLKRLMTILQTIDKICPDSSKNSAVFLEFTEDNNIFFRCTNPATQQKVLAYMKAYDTREMPWPELDEWERDLLGEKTSRKIKKEKRANVGKSLREINLRLKKKSDEEKKKFDKWTTKTKQRIRKEKTR
jgi:hypothetical protein